ncbi:MAG: hypothetical protein R2932_58605 [Caldilineaceae bacterium]
MEEEKNRILVLSELVPHLPENMLTEALSTAYEIENKRVRELILEDVVLKNETILSFLFHKLSYLPCSTFQKDLATFMPFILALAGDEAPQAAEGIYHAIQEVCGWWP